LQGIGKFPRLACVVVAVEQKKSTNQGRGVFGITCDVISLFLELTHYITINIGLVSI